MNETNQAIINLSDRISGLEKTQKSNGESIQKIISIVKDLTQSKLSNMIEKSVEKEIRKHLPEFLEKCPKLSEIKKDEKFGIIIQISRDISVVVENSTKVLNQVNQTPNRTEELLKETVAILDRIAS